MSSLSLHRWRRPAAPQRLDPYAAQRRRRPWAAWLLVLAVLPLAWLAGVVAGLGSPQLIILVFAMVLAPWVLLMPSKWLLSVLVFMATLGAGSLQYFAGVQQAHWVPTLLLAVMLVRIPLDGMRTRSLTERRSRTMSLLGGLLICFVLLVIASAAMNLVKPMQFLVGLRHYVFPLALVAAVLQSRAEPRFWQALLRGLPWLMIVQLPLCAYQYFFVEQSRLSAAFGAAGIGWDAVVGSFGGNPDGGGASGALALFLSFGAAGTLLLQRGGQIGRGLARASYLAIVGCAALAEIKVLIIFLPLALLLVDRKRVFRSVVSAVSWIGFTVLLAFLLLQAYNLLHYQSAKGRSYTVSESLERMFQAERDPRFFNPVTGEVSRVGAVLLWGDENIDRRLGVRTLIGYGPAASKISSLFGIGSAAKGKAYTLTTSTSTQLLWDLGLFGLLLFAGIAMLATWRALREAERLRAQPGLVVIAEMAALGLWLTLIGVFYNGDAINNPAVQVLLSLCLGWVLWLRQQPASELAPQRQP